MTCCYYSSERQALTARRLEASLGAGYSQVDDDLLDSTVYWKNGRLIRRPLPEDGTPMRRKSTCSLPCTLGPCVVSLVGTSPSA